MRIARLRFQWAKVVELVGTSDSSWEAAAKNAVEAAGQSLRDLRVAQINQLDMKVENGKVVAYRAKANRGVDDRLSDAEGSDVC